jgi:hypothetical protein
MRRKSLLKDIAYLFAGLFILFSNSCSKQEEEKLDVVFFLVDESPGRVQSKLEKLGPEDQPIVIVFSDNGGMSAANFGNPERIIQESEPDKAYSTSNLQMRGAKGWLYEGGIRGPMIVKWPSLGKQGMQRSGNNMIFLKQNPKRPAN